MQVTKHREVLAGEDKSTRAEAARKHEAYMSMHTKMAEMGVTRNNYTTTTVADLDNAHASLEAVLTSRVHAYEKVMQSYNSMPNVSNIFIDTTGVEASTA